MQLVAENWETRFSNFCVVLEVDISKIHDIVVTSLPPTTNTSSLIPRRKHASWLIAYKQIIQGEKSLTEYGLNLIVKAILIRVLKIYLDKEPVRKPDVLQLQQFEYIPREFADKIRPSPFKLGNFVMLSKALGTWNSANTQYVIDGFQNGFRIGYEGKREIRWQESVVSPILQERLLLDSQVKKEVKAGRVLGPLPNISPSWWKYAMVSPISLIPKKSMGVVIPGKWRLIFNLSWGKLWGLSVNDGIDKFDFSFNFITFKRICKLARKVGLGGFMWKADLLDAFRFVPMHPDDIPLLGYSFNDELYFETCLPFGVRSGPGIFAAVAKAIRNVSRIALDAPLLSNFLDDFFNIDSKENHVANAVSLVGFSDVLAILGIEKSPGKTLESANKMVILGLELDLNEQKVKVPEPRMTALKELLQEWTLRQSATKVQLQSLIGVLVFASYGVQWGRAFIRRLIEIMSPLAMQSTTVKLDSEVLSDIQWWIHYSTTSECNGISYLINPTPVHVEFWSDSCLSDCAGVWPELNTWWYHQFTPSEREWLTEINALELYAIVTNCATFGPQLKGQSLLLWSDNETAVNAINNRRSKDPALNSLIRELFFICSVNSFQIRAKHVPGAKNTLADCLSRPALRHKAWLLRPSLNLAPIRPSLPSGTW